MGKEFVIGLDIGTTSAKSVLFNKRGDVFSEYEVSYPLIFPKKGWVEQDPYVIEKAAIKAVRQSIERSNINKHEIISVGISSAMHSLICVDENGEALTHSITWADGRGVDQANRLRDSDLGKELYKKTGTPSHPMTPLVKLMWMKEGNFNPYRKAAKYISIKEFLLFHWFNEWVVDYSVASATGLFNCKNLIWEPSALVFAGITEDQLSHPVPPTYVLEGLKKEIADEMGIPLIPFTIGASDGPLANIGIGAIEHGNTAITIGTSGAIRQLVSSPKIDSKEEIFCYAVTKDLYVIGGPTNNGGIIFDWLKDVFVDKSEIQTAQNIGRNPYDLLIDTAKKAEPGSDGLIFHPYLNGERAPFWNNTVRGGYVDLTLKHKKEQLIRAALEGVMFNLYYIYQAVERTAGSSHSLYASGGFSRSSFLVQLLADVFGQEVYIPKNHQSSAWGAAWFSLLSLGYVTDLNSIKESIPMDDPVSPSRENHRIYKEAFKRFTEVLPK
ncbi:gluconokinase [Evansella sp. AB-P1]|uniref:gluconokinase n=1 Tax=Evansella sp. AB-P1 TaxID=3037653 RepID=UPI00241C2293|nr:gluconokinase [Evansella sp. AB-P1]MDG5786712.1 gluconokinase [Evansella sp. AB-P1]